MTKKQNSILFIIVGTICDILLMTLILLILIICGALILKEKVVNAIPFFFIISIVGGMFLFQKISAIVIKKFKLEEKLDPLFVRKRRNRLD
jgi:hypothetical protein